MCGPVQKAGAVKMTKNGCGQNTGMSENGGDKCCSQKNYDLVTYLKENGSGKIVTKIWGVVKFGKTGDGEVIIKKNGGGENVWPYI